MSGKLEIGLTFVIDFDQYSGLFDRDGDGFVDGTSFSTPQVAGLASYLWLLDDSLRVLPVESTLKLLKATSRSNAQVSGLIDAYGAVLALDARRGELRMRRELLDVSGPQGVPDSKFNEFDLLAFFLNPSHLGNRD